MKKVFASLFIFLAPVLLEAQRQRLTSRVQPTVIETENKEDLEMVAQEERDLVRQCADAP